MNYLNQYNKFLFYRIKTKNMIAIINKDGNWELDTKNKPNDFLCDKLDIPNVNFEKYVIIAVEKDIIEIFEFYQEDNNAKNNKLTRIYEISISNNNSLSNINFFNNNSNDNEILCIENINKTILCGHGNGLLSIWHSKPNIFLEKIKENKIHNNSINNIFKISENNINFITCSSDKTINICQMIDDRNVNISKNLNFQDEIIGIKLVSDFNNQRIFILIFKNGGLKGLNENLDCLFDIESRFQTKKTRYVIPLCSINTSDNNNKEDLLLISEDNKIDIFKWIKEGSFVVDLNKIHKNNIQNHKTNNYYPHPFFNQKPYRGRGGF